MKQKLFGAAAMVAFILFGVSCAEQKQSEFNFDSVKMEVTVSAKVTYDAGVEIDESDPKGYKIANAKPAVGRKVFIEIPFAQYSAGAAAGNQIFETVTDENGVFTISVPTKSTGVTADIRLEEFTAIHREYDKMVDGKPVFKTEYYTYETPAGLVGINLKPGAYKFPDNNDIAYNPVALDQEAFDENVTITGSINLAYETGFRQGAFKDAKNANVEFEILYAGMANPMTFGTTTDAQGNYKIVLPMKSLSEGFTINAIKVLGIGDNQFKHWISDTIAEPQIVKGAYQLAAITAGAPIAFTNVIDGITYDLGEKNLIFTPYYNAGITNVPQPDNWSNNLIGWAAGRGDLGFDESFSKTAKLTGKIYMPYLKAYGDADYKNERQTIILTGTVDPYKSGLTVITEADGSFSVDLPVADDTPINFSVALEKKDQPFTFIGSTKTIELYDGSYGPAAANIVNIKAEGTEWYELGDFYFKYVPKNTNTPDEWNADLIGWYRDPVFNKINPEKTVKGKFLYAVEQSYGIGKYEPRPYIVSISIDDDKDANVDRTIAVKPDAQGNISFDLPLKDILDQPDISVANANFPSKEYVHYTTFGKDESTLIDDIYTNYQTVYEGKDPKWNEKIGTQYFKFAVGTDVAKLPSTFHKDLVGWLIQKDGNDVMFTNSVKAQGQALKAVETSFLKGTYDPAKGEIIKVSIAYSTPVTVEVLTDKQGNFQFNIPIKNEGDEPKPSVAGAADIEIDNFTHYIDASNKKKILSGSYKGKSIKSSDAPWNDLGKIYYQFDPKTSEKAELWDGWDKYSKHIAGWQVKKDYEVKANVHGAVRIAQESSFWTGFYGEAKGFPVKIFVDYDKSGDETDGDLYYVVPSIMSGDEAGDFNVDILLKYADDDPDVAWISEALDIDKLGLTFEHYRNPGSDATEKLSGDYKEKSTIRTSSAYTEQGTRYYEFDNKGAAKNWESNLNGWYVWPADLKTSTTVTGAIRVAAERIEGSSIIACWNEAKYAKASVTVNGKTFRVCTGSNGKFSITFKFSEAVADLPLAVTMTIEPDEFDDNEFKHWTDNSNKNTLITTSGKYQDAKNVVGQSVDKVGSTAAYDLTKATPYSAKLKFKFNTPEPTGYDTYDWTSIVNNEK